MLKRITVSVVVILVLTGCTVHPRGEKEERAAALQAEKPFLHPAEGRPIPPLAPNASPEELVSYALLTNGDLEQKYWQWRSAIEQIPQDGTQPTNLVLFAGVPITNGSTAFDRTTVTAANDPMNDILWPTKLTRSAQRALDDAKAAGVRFQRARYELRTKVLIAWYDYSLTAELIRLEEADVRLLNSIATVSESRNRAGTGDQQDALKARNESDLSENSISVMRSQLVSERATLNALMGRPPAAPLAIPTTRPATQPIRATDDQIITLVARQNPELQALAHEIAGKKEGIELARLQYFPDFSVSAGTDLAGTAQNLMGMVTVPILRHEAIEAAIAQAQANLHATDAMRRQAANDVSASVVADLAACHDVDRQLELFEGIVLPRSRQIVILVRSAYETGRGSLLTLLESQRSLVAIERLVANLQSTRAKRIVDLEAIAAMRLDVPSN
jgi:cobalt-zinc-cadmium efflux system outer membrane protein